MFHEDPIKTNSQFHSNNPRWTLLKMSDQMKSKSLCSLSLTGRANKRTHYMLVGLCWINLIKQPYKIIDGTWFTFFVKSLGYYEGKSIHEFNFGML
jgi:hypothetical protein